MGVIVDWMISWHQGAAQRHEQQAKHHRAAERRWRGKVRPDPYECRGGSVWETWQAAHEWAEAYRAWALENRYQVISTPEFWVCTRGHKHARVQLVGPRGSVRGAPLGTPYPSGSG